MTQTEIRASHIGGRLFKSAASSALALSALTGGVMLSGGAASAACGDPLTSDCTIIDPVIGSFTNKATLISAPGSIGESISYEATGLFHPLSQTQIDTDFNPAPLTGAARTSTYTVDALTAGKPFDQVDLSWVEVPGGNAAVSAKYDWVDILGNPKTVTLTQSGSVFELVDRPTKITVTNTYTPNSGAIDNVENTFRNVPGPLPILGAGAAFGFSRKLRGRIKAARTA